MLPLLLESLESLQAEIGVKLTRADFIGFQTSEGEDASSSIEAEKASPPTRTPPTPALPTQTSAERLEARNLWLSGQSSRRSRSTTDLVGKKSRLAAGEKDGGCDCCYDVGAAASGDNDEDEGLLTILCLEGLHRSSRINVCI